MSSNEYEEKLHEKDKQIAELMKRVVELERRLGMNSGNSSKPPSSDGHRKKAGPKPKSLRCSGQQPSGGQKGHKGHTLEPVTEPNFLVRQSVTVCKNCQKDLTKKTIQQIIKRQVFDIPEPKIEVTQYESEVKICECGCVNTGIFPEGVNAPVQYGKRIAALTVYLSVQQMIPEDRLKEVFWDVFSLKISTATLAGLTGSFSRKIGSYVEETLRSLKVCAVKHLDETSIRIGTKTQWLHVISDEKETHYRVSQKRGNLLEDVKGIVVHDHWKPYFTLPNVQHSLCNAHHLRELKALQENEYKENWAFEMFDLLKTISHDIHLNQPLRPKIIREYTHRYDRILAKGFAFHEGLLPFSKPRSSRGRPKRRIGHNELVPKN